jgi:protein-disulfide isomerase
LPQKGAADALVTFVISSDFQCPFCARVVPTLRKLELQYGADVRWVWANQPLPFHDRARPAALAALAAHRQGLFWPMADRIFAHPAKLSDPHLEQWAKQLGLDMARFAADRVDPALDVQIDREAKAAELLKAGGTPSFFINGKLLQGAQPVEVFQAEIDAALAAARALRAKGKTGLELAAAAFAERDPVNGPQAFAFFVLGNLPAADAPVPADAVVDDDGPEAPDSREVWRVPVDAQRDAIRGDTAEAQVTIVAFADFQCPFCARGAKTLDQLQQAYGRKVRWVFKHKPLPFHVQARPAALAAIAAGKQGKFWSFQQLAFDHMPQLDEAHFMSWAKDLGLNLAEFESDRRSPAAEAQLAADEALSAAVGVTGTPTFFVNGRRVVGAQPVAVFKALIDDELAKAAARKGPAYYDGLIASGKQYRDLADEAQPLQLDGLPFKGPKDAKVTIAVFSDFQCPYCARMSRLLDDAWRPRKDRIKLVMVPFPLSFHPWARPAATAAQVAWEQGANTFWALHDALFAEQRSLSQAGIEELAQRAGVDSAKLQQAQRSRKYDALFDATTAMGTRVGVEGTPTVYINGRKYDPLSGFEHLGKTLDELLK